MKNVRNNHNLEHGKLDGDVCIVCVTMSCVVATHVVLFLMTSAAKRMGLSC